MKKSTKLIIGLTFLAATATAASVAIAVTTITRKTPKKQLSNQIKIFEEELETNKELKEFQKAEIKLALEAAQAVLSNPESSDEQIKNALDVLVKKVEEIKAKTEQPENPGTQEPETPTPQPENPGTQEPETPTPQPENPGTQEPET
ncbi:hypothetical protein Q8W60_01850, partial [Mycoplasmopsis arginini]